MTSGANWIRFRTDDLLLSCLGPVFARPRASQFAAECKNNPSRILIGHPFNPAHLVPLVEVVPHRRTGDSYTARVMEFYKYLGKSPVLVKKVTPGFIANRLLAALCKEAYSLVQRGILSASDLG
jgi:3-hydroxyacyl-CoA dehydrogenase